MKFFTYRVEGKNGIHARPIKKGDRDADAKRLFSVMSLGAREGDELSFFINGVDEAEAAAALEDTLRRAFENERE